MTKKGLLMISLATTQMPMEQALVKKVRGLVDLGLRDLKEWILIFLIFPLAAEA